jgi:hypothetical protein
MDTDISNVVLFDPVSVVDVDVADVVHVDVDFGSNVHISGVSMVSFNMHGFNQGNSALELILSDFNPDFVLLQEHWLTPDKLYLLSNYSSYITFACSAMYDRLGSGPLYGRPFGGMAILARRRVAHACRSIAVNDRYLVIGFGNIVYYVTFIYPVRVLLTAL